MSPIIHQQNHHPSLSGRPHMNWEFLCRESTETMNNSVLLTSCNLTRSHESSVNPCLLVSDNDGSITLYDIPLSNTSRQEAHKVGHVVTKDVAVNHCERTMPMPLRTVVHRFIFH